MKRIIDILFSLFVLLTFPLQILFAGTSIIISAALVISGKKTWIGYSIVDNKLPPIRSSVLTTTGHLFNEELSLNKDSLKKIDYWYAKEYQWMHDVRLLLKYYRSL